MHNSYRFSNLLGATYQGGSIQFTPDGNTLLSPVGNRVNAVDLIQGRCSTLAPENLDDIRLLALSPDGRLLLTVDRGGRALVLNFVRAAVLCRINLKGTAQSAKWSPDNAWLAVAVDSKLVLWRAPRLQTGWQFVRHRTFAGHHDDIIDVSWAPDSYFLATCSKDMVVKLWSLNPVEGFEPLTIVEHRSPVRAVFFSADMHYLYSLSREGVLVSLRYDLKEPARQASSDAAPELQAQRRGKQLLYSQPGSWEMAAKAYCQQPGTQRVTRCAFDGPSRLLAVGFDGGIFMLFEVPDLQALQTLSLGNEPLDAIALGANGDWLAVGSAGIGQLLVWEWRSETYILKQQGHHWGVKCVAFSPAGSSSMRREKTLATVEGRPEEQGNSAIGGRLMASGGYDGKVKLFNAQSGLCFVTFAEHTAPVSDIAFTPQGNAVLSASHDGSLRAFDLLRYRNFRTFVSPEGLCRWSSIAVDSGGEIVAASATGGQYSIHVWSIQTGNLLDVLTGHTSHVQAVRFSPSAGHPGQVLTASWDGTLFVWDLFAGSKGGTPEKLTCSSSVLTVTFDPRGNDLCAAACLSGQVLFWNVDNGQQVGLIEGLRDIQSGRQWRDQFSATHKKGKPGQQGVGKAGPSDGVNLNQHFNALAYVRGGDLLLCGSRNSPLVCLYDTASYSLSARYTLTSNRSLSGVQPMLDSRNMTEAGAAWQEFDLSDDDADDYDVAVRAKRRRQAAALPGVTVGEAKDMYTDRELHVWDVAFSADSQQFAVATTHGIFVYVADLGLGTPTAAASHYGSDASRFVPQMLTRNVSAPAIVKALEAGHRTRAMILALALNDYGLLRRVYEAIPLRAVPLVVASIGAPLLPALIWFLASELRPVGGTPHFQFHVTWIMAVIDVHFLTLMDMSMGKTTARTGSALEAASASHADVAGSALQLLVELTQRHTSMSKVFSSNSYLLQYLGGAPVASDEQGDAGTRVAERSAVLPQDRVAFFHGEARKPQLEELGELEDVAQEGEDDEAAERIGAVKKKGRKKSRAGAGPGAVVPDNSGQRKRRRKASAAAT